MGGEYVATWGGPFGDDSGISHAQVEQYLKNKFASTTPEVQRFLDQKAKREASSSSSSEIETEKEDSSSPLPPPVILSNLLEEQEMDAFIACCQVHGLLFQEDSGKGPVKDGSETHSDYETERQTEKTEKNISISEVEVVESLAFTSYKMPTGVVSDP